MAKLAEKQKPYTTFVGMPASLKLDWFGRELWEAFDTTAYLVGSATCSRDWRDVDVRVILGDEEYASRVGDFTRPRCLNLRWNVLCLAFSARGREITGLPIDFQIDQMTAANERFGSEIRHPLGIQWQLNQAKAA